MTDTLRRTSSRSAMALAALMVLLLMVVAPLTAQDLSRTLVSGTTISDTMGPDRSALTYVFDAAVGSSATLVAESMLGNELNLLISDSNGNEIASARHDAAEGHTRIEGAPLVVGGRFLAFVYFAAGSSTAATAVDISLEIGQIEAGAGDADAASTGVDDSGQLLLAAGIEVSLNWIGAADLNLQVRDPSGETLYWDSRTTDNGGEFGFDANGLCQVISPSPVETATWQPGFLPSGSYEVLVFYREACDSAVGSVAFSVQVRVDGALSGTIGGTLSPPSPGQDSVYVSRFVIDVDGAATVSPGGVYPDSSLTRLPSGFDIGTNIPLPISRDVPVTGAVTNETPYVTYSFAGVSGDVISLDMQAVGPNLDTLLQIVDSAGAVVSVNDDGVGTTNSSISNARLLNSGTYTIIATRYGQEIGGTEGQFQLTLTGLTGDVSQDLTALELPEGDIEVTLLWGTSADLQLLARDPVGGVVFDDVPLSNSGGILQEAGNVNCIPAASGAPVSYIYWPLGRMRPGTYEVEVWYQNTCEEQPPVVEFTLVIEVRGQQIAVERRFPLPNQRFVTNFTILPDATATRGEGGFIDGGSDNLPWQDESFSAPQIASGETISGTITPSNTFDVYSFQGEAGDTVTIRMSATTSALDANLYLISPSFLEIAANDDGDPVLLGTSGRSTDAIISDVILPENGPYTVIATRFGTRFGGTIGNYSLTLERS